MKSKSQKDKEEFNELARIMRKMKNKTASDEEKKRYAKLRETVQGKIPTQEEFVKKIKQRNMPLKEKLSKSVKETRKITTKGPKGRPVLKTKKTSGGKTLLGEIKKRIGENRKTKRKTTYKAGRR